jgi:predicted ATP-dependent serine protease
LVRGRDAELSVLGDLLARVRSGRAGVVVIEGAPGLGKSRLLSEVQQMARRVAVGFCVGAAEPSQTAAEFAPLLRALSDGPEPVLDRAAMVGLRAVREQRCWLLQDLQSLLERAALTRPLVICLDDLQSAMGGRWQPYARCPGRWTPFRSAGLSPRARTRDRRHSVTPSAG